MITKSFDIVILLFDNYHTITMTINVIKYTPIILLPR